MKAPITAVALATVTALAAITPAAAARYPTHNDLDKRPVDAIAAELGVTGETFASCFYDVKPAEDFKPTKARERSNKAVLLPCLQAENPNITNDLLDSVMNKYRGQHIR